MESHFLVLREREKEGRREEGEKGRKKGREREGGRCETKHDNTR